MTFSKRQFTAIYKMACAMAAADGKIERTEMAVMFHELQAFNVSKADWQKICADSEAMDFSESIDIISSFNHEQKRYVCAYLAGIMMADDDINDDEVRLWRFITVVCNLPAMTVSEAAQYMINRMK